MLKLDTVGEHLGVFPAQDKYEGLYHEASQFFWVQGTSASGGKANVHICVGGDGLNHLCRCDMIYQSNWTTLYSIT